MKEKISPILFRDSKCVCLNERICSDGLLLLLRRYRAYLLFTRCNRSLLCEFILDRCDIASNFHQWSNRGTSRLVLFDNDLTPLGDYGHLDLIPMVKDKSTLLFPCEAEWGNEWNFTNGINRTIRVDGSLYSFEVYNKKIGEWYLIDLDKDILHLNVEKRLKEIEKIEGITDTY